MARTCRHRRPALTALTALAATAATTVAIGDADGAVGPNDSGGAPIAARTHHDDGPAGRRGHWLRGVSVTEYWPAPEAWFRGALVRAPGLRGRHRVDWLYSASGISMQGSGLGLDGRPYHLAAAGRGGWVTAAGRPTSAAGGAPYWRAGGYWLGPARQVTFPLAAGGWSAGRGRRHLGLPGVRFAAGAGGHLRYGRSIAVDPSVIALGSRVYIPAYRGDGHGGWFTASDTGGGVSGRHVDVYRRPPSDPADPGTTRRSQRVFVVARGS